MTQAEGQILPFKVIILVSREIVVSWSAEFIASTFYENLFWDQ